MKPVQQLSIFASVSVLIVCLTFSAGFASAGSIGIPSGGVISYPGIVYFKAGENLGDWYPYGNVEPGISMVTSPVYKGAYAYKMFRAGLDTQPHTMINWGQSVHQKEAYTGFALYIPSDFSSPEWCVIYEFCQENPFRKNLVLYYNYDASFGTEALQLVTWSPDNAFHLLYRQTLPRDQWIKIILFGRMDDVDGRVVLWIDGQQVYDSGNINLMFEREEFCSYMLGIYCDVSNPYDMTLYFDQAVVASTLEKTMQELSPT